MMKLLKYLFIYVGTILIFIIFNHLIANVLIKEPKIADILFISIYAHTGLTGIVIYLLYQLRKDLDLW